MSMSVHMDISGSRMNDHAFFSPPFFTHNRLIVFGDK